MHALKTFFTYLIFPHLVTSGPLAATHRPPTSPPYPPGALRNSIPPPNNNSSDSVPYNWACAFHDPVTRLLEQNICFEAWRSWLSSHMAKTYILTRDPTHMPPQPPRVPQWVFVPSNSDFGDCRVRLNVWPLRPVSTEDRSIAQNTMLQGINEIWMHCFTMGEEGERYDGGYVIFENEGRGQVILSVLHGQAKELDEEAVKSLFSDAEKGTVSPTGAAGTLLPVASYKSQSGIAPSRDMRRRAPKKVDRDQPANMTKEQDSMHSKMSHHIDEDIYFEKKVLARHLEKLMP